MSMKSIAQAARTQKGVVAIEYALVAAGIAVLTQRFLLRSGC